MAPVVSPSQIEFFEKLTREKQFPAGSDIAALIEQFKTLNSASGSDWIEKALGLPDSDEGPKVPPAF
jgi:hypothetical protein